MLNEQVMKLANLQRRDTMYPLHLTIVLVGVGVGVQMVTMAGQIVETAEQSAWISLLLGAVIWGGIACGMVRLGQEYPEDTFVEYMPKLLGSRLGHAVAWYVFLMLALMYCILLRNFTDIIAMTMFDRTPLDVIAMAMLGLSVYGAMQRWGAVLRITQYFVLTATPALLLIWAATILNFNIENVMPLFPDNPLMLLKGAVLSWDYYSGYEIILILLPFVRQGSPSAVRAVGLAFVVMAILYAIGMLIVIGSLTVGSVKQEAYPMFAAVRGVQIPGTFVERLENYLLITWIPIVFDTLMLVLFGAAQIAMRLCCLSDHRPHLILLAPFLFIGVTLLDRLEELKAASKVLTWLGISFSLGIIPLCLLLVWVRRKNG